MLWCTEADYLRYLRVGFSVAVSHTHTSAYRHIKAFKLAFFDNRDIAQILREYIDVIRRWNSNADLEFTRQVDAAINWLLLFIVSLTVDNLLAVQPNFVICLRFRI
ncbi:hypothetical protein D3C80_1936240 [compost metagenome]